MGQVRVDIFYTIFVQLVKQTLTQNEISTWSRLTRKGPKFRKMIWTWHDNTNC